MNTNACPHPPPPGGGAETIGMDMPSIDVTQGYHASCTCAIDMASQRLSLRTLISMSRRDAQEDVAGYKISTVGGLISVPLQAKLDKSN
jgi:hypothetical protein